MLEGRENGLGQQTAVKESPHGRQSISHGGRWTRFTDTVHRLKDRVTLFFEDPEVKRVISGEKPAMEAKFRINANNSSEAARFYEKYGLEAIPIIHPGEKVITNVALGLPGTTVESIIKEKGIPQIPEFQEKIDKLLEDLKTKSAAQALAELAQTGTPRKDMKKDLAWTAAATGLLLGYKLCNIESYIGVNYLGKKQYKEFGHTRLGNDNEVLCEDCVKRSHIKSS